MKEFKEFLLSWLMELGNLSFEEQSARGPYTNRFPLGRPSGEAVVFEAQDAFGRRVAIKEYNSPWYISGAHTREELEKKLRQLGNIRHPNILPVLDSYIEQENFPPLPDGRVPPALAKPRIVTPYVDGQTLAERVEAKQLSLEEALTIAEQVTSGLEAMHAQGLIHHDVKPDNIMVDKSGHVYLLEAYKSVQQTDGMRSQLSRIATTERYRAPESDASDDNPSTDVYSLAMTLLDCLHGQPYPAKYNGKPSHIGAAVYATLLRNIGPQHDRDATPTLFLQSLWRAHTNGTALTSGTNREVPAHYADAHHALVDLYTSQEWKDAPLTRRAILAAQRISLIDRIHHEGETAHIKTDGIRVDLATELRRIINDPCYDTNKTVLRIRAGEKLSDIVSAEIERIPIFSFSDWRKQRMQETCNDVITTESSKVANSVSMLTTLAVVSGSAVGYAILGAKGAATFGAAALGFLAGTVYLIARKDGLLFLIKGLDTVVTKANAQNFDNLLAGK